MSKSTGNFIEPIALIDQYGVDAVRYFLMREMNVGQDSDFSDAQFLARYNADLANNLGNLVNRTLNMTNRFAVGLVPASVEVGEPETELRQLWSKTQADVTALWTDFQFHTGLERTIGFVSATNAYIEKRAPWKLGKSTEASDKALLESSLATMAESLRLTAALLQPFMPQTVDKIYAVLGYNPGSIWSDELAWGDRLKGNKVAESLVLFPRVQSEKSPAKS